MSARRNRTKGWGKAISRILPGDHVHAVAPISARTPTTGDRLEQIDAAVAKRIRKQRARTKRGL